MYDAGMARIRRREFLKRAAVATAGFTIVPRFVLGGQGYTAPSDELTKAIIGVGNMGLGHISYEGARVLAVCDVDGSHLAQALEACPAGVKSYRDFREVLARPDVDIVHVATPPHWHALIAAAAVEAGKDVWCEKPLTRTIGEGRKLVDAVRRTGRMLRVNTWFRFTDEYYGFGSTVAPLKKAAFNRLLGWPLKATLNESTGFNWKLQWNGKTYLPSSPRAARARLRLLARPGPLEALPPAPGPLELPGLLGL